MSDTYVRSEAEVAHQQQYEAKEALLHGSGAQVHYRVIEEPPPPDIIVRKTAWRVARRIGEGEEGMSRWIFRKVEVTEYIREQTRQDELAAKRLGLRVHVTVAR